MNKSVYSLVLSDEVIAAVDRAAYRAGMSRSAFISGVLAEAVSYTTPEKRMSGIFSEIEQLMNGDIFRIMPRPSDSALAIRSALQYKYKPVIRYGIELYRSFDNSIGKLKVSLRTQSESLIGEFERFTELWMRLEQQYIIGHFPHGITYETGDGKFTRTFCLPPDKHKLTDDAIAAALSEYITMFDDIIKLYFANCSDREKAAALVHKRYEEYYAGNMPVI